MSILPLSWPSLGSAFENKSAVSMILRTIWEISCCPASPCHFRVALADSRTSFLCNFAISNAYYDRAASLHPEHYLLHRKMLCVKPSYPAQSALIRQDSAESTQMCGVSPPARNFPALARGRPFSSSLGYWGLQLFCTKLDYPLVTFILFVET